MQTMTVDATEVGYIEAGGGEPPIVFVHGWSCDHTFFAPQADHFSTAHRCVSVDLRGHHGLQAPPGTATIPTHARDVRAICEALELEGPVIVGHSMGGAIALELAAQASALPAGLVLVDPTLIPSEAKPQVEELVAALESPEYKEAARGFIEQNLFMPSDDEAVRTRGLEVMLGAPQDVMASEMRSIGEWNASRPSHTWTLPVLSILSEQTIVVPGSLGEHCADLETVTTPRVGHFNQLLAPGAVNEAMEKFLARL